MQTLLEFVQNFNFYLSDYMPELGFTSLLKRDLFKFDVLVKG